MTAEREDRIVAELRELRRCIESNATYVIVMLGLLAIEMCGK